jgi:murein DD-endopeptidase MepM/ murein hydrolase activator NlpD
MNQSSDSKFSINKWLLSGLFVLAVCVTWGSYQMGLRDGAAQVDTQMEQQLLAEIRQQGAQVKELEQATAASLDALALQVGNIRGQAMRLDALGERLVDQSGLDTGEFDFSSVPAVGGYGDGPGASQSAAEITAELGSVARLLQDRKSKLDLLQDMLMNRELRKEITPSGFPVKQGYMTSGYGSRTDPFSGKKKSHKGVDFAGKPGTEVIAVASGVVIKSERHRGFGNIVELRHPDGYVTRYAHNKQNLIKEGELVEKGQTIALLGSTGRSSGPHVHFEVSRNGRSVNPGRLIKQK